MIRIIQVGSQVTYSIAFLHGIGCYTGSVATARGIVTGFERLGSDTLALIDWADSAVPEKVNVNNLSLFSRNPAFCQC